MGQTQQRRPPDQASGPAQSQQGSSKVRQEKQQLKGMSYEEQQEQLGPPAEAELDPQEALGRAQQGFFSASAGATYKEGGQIAESEGYSLVLDPGTRFSATLYGDSIHFRAEPGLAVKIPWMPDVRIQSVSYSFADGNFTSQAEGDKVDLFGLIGWAAEKKINAMLEAKLRPLMPAKLTQKGYNVRTDGDLPGTITQLQKCFALGGEGGGVAIPLTDIINPSASLNLTNPKELRVPLSDQGLEFLMPAGVGLYLSADASGSVMAPVVNQIYLRANHPGLTIQSTGKGFSDAFKKLDINSVTIGKGGTFQFDYDLMVEDLVNGGIALVELMALLSGQHVSSHRDVKLEAARKQVDELMQQKVPPLFKAWLLQNDGLIPGISLKTFFGM